LISNTVYNILKYPNLETVINCFSEMLNFRLFDIVQLQTNVRLKS